MGLKKIFIPSTGGDLVFNLNSLSPYAKSSIIYDIDHDEQIIIMPQPLNPLTENFGYDEMHLSMGLK